MAVGLVNRYNIFGIIIKLTMKQSILYYRFSRKFQILRSLLINEITIKYNKIMSDRGIHIKIKMLSLFTKIYTF